LHSGLPVPIDEIAAVGHRACTAASNGNLCDNAIQIEPNCYYTIHTVFDYQCSGGWNVNEGFNPDYCQITQIVSVECELQYCEDPGVDLIQECMNNGYTQAECMCQVYGLGCENLGGEEDDEAITTVDWLVFPMPNSSPGNNWDGIRSLETFKGKRVSTEPQGGHFKWISHNWSVCTFCSTNNPHDVYYETGSATSLPTPQTAKSHVTGKLNFKGDPYNIDNAKTFNFQDVF
jgi:hypothetical protein